MNNIRQIAVTAYNRRGQMKGRVTRNVQGVSLEAVEHDVAALKRQLKAGQGGRYEMQALGDDAVVERVDENKKWHKGEDAIGAWA